MNYLLAYYKDKNTIPSWFEKYTSVARENMMYAYKGTNGRELTSFMEIFRKFEEVEGVKRSEWPRSPRTGQEVHKQYPVPMITSKLFYKDDKGIYYKTAKGKSFDKFLQLELGVEDKWIINYLYLIDSFIMNKENYLISRSVEIRNKLMKSIEETKLDNLCFKFLKDINKINNVNELFKEEYTLINVFFNESEMLEKIDRSNPQEILELQNYVTNNYNNQSYCCCISKKFKPGGQYTINMLKDDIKVYCFSNIISKIKYTNFEDTVTSLLNLYKNYFYFEDEKVKEYIFEEKNIFEPIFMNVFNVEDIEDIEESDIEEYIPEFHDPTKSIITSDVPEPRIDDTTIEGKQQLRQVFAMRKRIAREVSGFKCELETLRGCRYFTSKTTNKNYIEVHHFLPREFRNNFQNSLDVLSNYICLCPSCHRMIHLATDRERVDIIRYIYNLRKDRLHNCGLDIELNDLLDFYNVEGES